MDLLKLAIAIDDLEKKQRMLEINQANIFQNIKILMSNTRKAFAYAVALRKILVAKNTTTDEEMDKQFGAEINVLLEKEQYEMEKAQKQKQILLPKGVIVKQGG